MNLPFGILKQINHGSNQVWSVSKCLILFHPLYYFYKSRRQIFKVVFFWLDVWFLELLPSRDSCLRGPHVLAKASTVKLPGSELQCPSWRAGWSPNVAEDHATIVFPSMGSLIRRHWERLQERLDCFSLGSLSKAVWKMFAELSTTRSSQLGLLPGKGFNVFSWPCVCTGFRAPGRITIPFLLHQHVLPSVSELP